MVTALALLLACAPVDADDTAALDTAALDTADDTADDTAGPGRPLDGEGAQEVAATLNYVLLNTLTTRLGTIIEEASPATGGAPFSTSLSAGRDWSGAVTVDGNLRYSFYEDYGDGEIDADGAMRVDITLEQVTRGGLTLNAELSGVLQFRQGAYGEGGYLWGSLAGELVVEGDISDSAGFGFVASYDDDGRGDPTINFAIEEGKLGGYAIKGMEGGWDLGY
jgi:hypothetical protein